MVSAYGYHAAHLAGHFVDQLWKLKIIEVQKKISIYQEKTPSSGKLPFLCWRSISFLLEIMKDRGHKKEAIRNKTLTMAVRNRTEPRESLLLTAAVAAVVAAVITSFVDFSKLGTSVIHVWNWSRLYNLDILCFASNTEYQTSWSWSVSN